MIVRSSARRSALLAGSLLCLTAAAPPRTDWPTLGHDLGGQRYAPLNQITPANVAKLKPVWTFHMRTTGEAAAASEAEVAQARSEQAGPAGAPARFGESADGLVGSESIPLVVGDTMYLGTPYSSVVALDAATGKTRWVHHLPENVRPSTRGIDFWAGDKNHAPAILFGTSDGKLRSIRASDGKPTASFGEDGAISLRTDDVMVGGKGKPYSLTSPPIIYKNLVITGSAVGEAVGGSRGDVRAWDAATGKRVWTFKSVPAKGERFGDTWGGDSGHNRSGVNAWGLMTVDAERGIVFMPFGAPANDRVGVDRPGDNLFGTSVVAADAATGKYLWHFQIVHHDIWDNDAEAPPLLFDVRKGGKTIPAVGILSKNGLVFILDRTTGKPIYPIEERPVPKSDVPSEITSPTQPFPTVTPPLSRMSLTADELSTITPDHAAFCRKLVEDNKMTMGGAYTPPPFNRPGVYFPGTIGGVNWHGGTVDPKRGLLIVNSFQLGQIMQIVPDGKGGFANRGELNGRFWDPETRLPCNAGSWGDMTAIDINTGKVAWKVRNGISENLPEALQKTGRPSTGGPISTAGGLVFSAGTDDHRFRAFDSRTGREVWTYKLPASAHTNPISYQVGKRQYVAIVSTGGSFVGSPIESDQLTVFALPQGGK